MNSKNNSKSKIENKSLKVGEQELKFRKDKNELITLFFKLVGAVILLASFCTQNFMYTKWDAKSKNSWDGIRDQANADRSALLYQILYFTAHWEDKDLLGQNPIAVKNEFIKMSARHHYYAKLDWIYSSNLSEEDKIRYPDSLLLQCSKVNDYPSYLIFIGYINYFDSTHLSTKIGKADDDLRENKELARKIYFALYLLGTALISGAGVFEIRTKYKVLKNPISQETK